MKIMIISGDHELVESIENSTLDNQDVEFVSEVSDPLEVTSHVCENTPTAIIIDDDQLKPNSAKILRSIRKLRENVHIVFLTSDTSIELGREITPLGIHFYGMKPISQNTIANIMESLNKLNNKSVTN